VNNAAPCTVLIADDDLVVLKVLALKFTTLGFRVLKVAQASQVVRQITQHRPDVVLLDINLGSAGAGHGAVEWDGIKILDWLARLEGVSAIPVIIITSDLREETRRRCGRAAAYFTKPVDFEVLVREINRLTAPAA
jgi:CheY-like chemotaxis protein